MCDQHICDAPTHLSLTPAPFITKRNLCNSKGAATNSLRLTQTRPQTLQ